MISMWPPSLCLLPPACQAKRQEMRCASPCVSNSSHNVVLTGVRRAPQSESFGGDESKRPVNFGGRENGNNNKKKERKKKKKQPTAPSAAVATAAAAASGFNDAHSRCREAGARPKALVFHFVSLRC